MIYLDLTCSEVGTLVAMLECELSELRVEIGNTDSQDFRDTLKAKKAVLTKVIDTLTATRQTA